jgi:hypothetical protein
MWEEFITLIRKISKDDNDSNGEAAEKMGG